MMKNPIENIFSPMTRFSFLEEYQADRPVIVHGLETKLNELFKLPLLNSLDELFEQWPDQVNAYLKGIADEVNSKKISTNEAKKEFQEKKSGLFFDDVHNYSPLINEWLNSIQEDLGLSYLTYARSLIYVLAKGEGTSTHFDQNINFVLQISGTKKWWVAENTQVKNPMTRHTLGAELDPELDSYRDQEMPLAMPDNAKEFILAPGSLLFLPRGAWHKTEAISDAISLNFTYSSPTWIDLFTTALRSRLAQSPDWRETANYVNDAELASHATQKFEMLLSDLAEDVPNWKAEDILNATEQP